MHTLFFWNVIYRIEMWILSQNKLIFFFKDMSHQQGEERGNLDLETKCQMNLTD